MIEEFRGNTELHHHTAISELVGSCKGDLLASCYLYMYDTAVSIEGDL